MLVLLLPYVSSRVAGFPVGSLFLWAKLQNLSFSKVSNCETWRKPEEVSHKMLDFFCAHVYRLESLVFLWARRVYGGSCKTSPFQRFPSRLSCRYAWQAWHFVTFQLYTLHSTLYTPHSTLYTLHNSLHTLTPHSTL